MMRIFLPLGFFLILASAVPLRAETLFIPHPEYGPGARPQTRIQVRNNAAVPKALQSTFIPTGQDGTAAGSRTTAFGGGGRNFNFLAASLLPGTGMLKLETPAEIDLVEAAVFLEHNSNSTNWELPMISLAEAYGAGETAYLQGMERTAALTSNVEILNLGDAPAICALRFLKQDGSLLGTRTEDRLPPQSHRVLRNVLSVAGAPATLAGARAEISCDQTFYAYGTAYTASPLDFRLLYPLDGPPLAYTQPVRVNRAGTFFSPVAGSSFFDVKVPLVRGVAYRRATIEFDMTISRFSHVFDALVGMYHSGGPRFNKTLFFGTFLRGTRRRMLVDQGSPVLEPALKRSAAFQEGKSYKVRIVYDTEASLVTFQASQAGRLVIYAQGGAFNHELVDRGQPIVLRFGLPGVADGAYFPPYGWKFANLKVEFSR